jgi:hypothetical protein
MFRTKHIDVTIQFDWIQFPFINTLSQQPSGRWKEDHNIQTQVTENNKQDTYETIQQNKEKNA